MIMAERMIRVGELSEQTGISRNTISAMYYDKSKMIKFSTLSKLCEVLMVLPDDLLRYTKG